MKSRLLFPKLMGLAGFVCWLVFPGSGWSQVAQDTCQTGNENLIFTEGIRNRSKRTGKVEVFPYRRKVNPDSSTAGKHFWWEWRDLLGFVRRGLELRDTLTPREIEAEMEAFKVNYGERKFAPFGKGFPQKNFRISNLSEQTVRIIPQDWEIPIIAEAKLPDGSWVPVQFWLGSWCGNSSDHEIRLAPGESMVIRAMTPEGEIKAKLRFKISLGKQIVYSPEFKASYRKCDLVRDTFWEPYASYLDPPK